MMLSGRYSASVSLMFVLLFFPKFVSDAALYPRCSATVSSYLFLPFVLPRSGSLLDILLFFFLCFLAYDTLLGCVVW